MSKNILVTGANGYIGSQIVKKILDSGDNVIAVDINDSNIDIRAKFVNFDIFDNTKNICDTIGVPDVCLHMAYVDGFNHNSFSHLKYLPLHFDFIKNIIEAGTKHVAVMGTMHEIGYFEGKVDENTPCNPLSYYGIAKNALRQAIFTYLQNKETIFQWLRAFYITGNDAKGKSVFSKILQMAAEGKETFPFTDGKNKYDFIGIEDLAEQIFKTITQEGFDGIINCCSGNPVSLKDKVEEFIKEKGLNIKPEYGAFPSRKYDSPAIWGDTAKIKKIMGK